MIYIIETKTTSEDIAPGSPYWVRTRMDVQIDVYLRAMRQQGIDVASVCYDVLVRPRCKPYQATPPELRKYTKPTKKDPVSRLYANQREYDETVDEYEARCLSMIASAPETFYQRGIVVRFEKESDEAAADIWATTQSMRDATRLHMFPRNVDSCAQWGRMCELLPICEGAASPDDPMLFRRETSQHEELELSGDSVRVTQSAIRTFRSCPRKYELRYVKGVRSLIRPEPLLTGTSIHAGIELLRKGVSLADALLKVNDPLRSYSSAKERAMLRGYVARWGLPRGIVAAEKQFEVPLLNPATGAASKTYTLAGKLDALAECEEWELLDPWRAS